MNSKDIKAARDNLPQSALGGSAITPGTAIGFDTRAIYVGVTGNLVAVMASGQTVTFSNIPVGLWPLSISLVVASGTTATSLVALY